MSSSGNEVSRWNLRHVRRIAELLEPVALPRYANRFSSEKPISDIDQCLHIPGKADSAYSSFSGGSNIPECPIPSCYNEHDSLPLEQMPYMDSGYVRSIYNPSAIHSDFRQLNEDKQVEMSRHNLDNACHSRQNGSTLTHGIVYQPPSLVARLAPLPCPPSPQVQADRNVEQPHSGICIDYSVQSEQHVRYANEELPLDSLANCLEDRWLSRCKRESLITEEGDIWHATNPNTTKKSNSTIATKPCFTFQESDSLDKTHQILNAQNSVHTYKIPEEMNSKSSPSLRRSHSAVNDTQENKQYFYACSVHKPPFTDVELPSTVAVSSKLEGQLHGVQHPFEAADYSGLDQDRCENRLSLKDTDSSLSNEAALGIIKSYEDKKRCFSSEGGTSRDVWQQLLKQQTRMQKPQFHGLDMGETPHYDTADTISYYKQDENSASQMISGFRKAKQNDNYSSPDLLTNLRLEEMLKPVHFPKQQFSKMTESQSQDNSASVKINRKTTPLLYYLSGGKNANIMSHKNQAQEEDDFAIKTPRSNCPTSAEPIEIPKDSDHYVDDIASKNKGLILGSPASSVDEKFKDDYREKLKVAQRKVLRETSFKRKDLQMSLPIRLKQKASSRPSIQHLRSFSLSSTHEDSKPIPSPKPLETISKEEESKRPLTIRIGGRKRATKEQKKISYSEPEKLNQLDDQRDQSISWKKKNARSRSDEISEQDTRIIRSKALENQSRALSKAELKQIQHNALVEYMERKIGQRPGTAQSSTQQKSPLQWRPSHSKAVSEDNTSNPSTSRKLHNMDGFCPFLAPGRIPDPPSFPSALTSTAAATHIANASCSVSEMANSAVQPAVSEGSCASKCALTKSVLHSGAAASNKDRGKPSSSPMQDSYRSTVFSALSSQDQETYPTHPSSLSKDEVEVDPPDKKDSLATVKQSTSTAGRRGKSMEETGTSEMVRLSPLSQSTDQLHHLKSWRLPSGLETCKNSQGANQQNILQNCESASEHLSRQSRGVASLKGFDPTAHELEQSHNPMKFNSTSISLGHPSLCHVPSLSVGRMQSSMVPLESLSSSPASFPIETDNDVFKDSFVSGSETVSNLPPLYRQSKNSIPDRQTPEPALTASTLRTSTEGNRIKEDHRISILCPAKEDHLESKNGDSGENKNSSENLHCLEMAPALPVFLPKEESNKDSQWKKEILSPQWQQLEVNGPTHHSGNRTHCCTSLIDNQVDNNTSHPLAEAKALPKEQDHKFLVQEAGLSVTQSKSPEDQKCEDLAIEIIAKDKSLVDILMPHSLRKTALDLMEGLFPASISMSDRLCRKKGRIQENEQSSDGLTVSSHETGNSLGQRAEDATFHMNQVLRKNQERLDDPDDITSKKRELISSIQLKLQTLWDERELLQFEAKEHAVHGKDLEAMVQDLCKPNEYERYMMFIGDLEKVVSLLLCLSSRLARVQNAMEKIDENTDAEEKQSLHERHRLLSRQREDAKDLKENLDRRERVVSGILSKYMTESQLQDYRHFVQAKTSLLMEQKHLEEQVNFLEEQLERLRKSIPP